VGVEGTAEAGSGTFTVTVAVSDVTSRLKTVTFPETTGGGAVYPQEGAQTATVSHAYAFTSESTFSGSGAVTVSDRAGNVAGVPLTVTRDVASPTAVLTVAKRSSSVTLTVAWGGEDGTGAGVATYDVQVREDEGGWTDWLTETGQTQEEYVGQYGHRYGFRVRATDQVSNTGDWVEGTSFLAWVTKYYAFNGQRVAMREGDVVYYLHGDHLGSTSVASSDSGVLHSRQGYYPYGEMRYVTGELPTEFGFTGQRNDSYIKLIQMGARWYNPVTGRWISADSIVPEPGNPQALNRYLYVNNNPHRFVDLTGHEGVPWWKRCINGWKNALGIADRDDSNERRALVHQMAVDLHAQTLRPSSISDLESISQLAEFTAGFYEGVPQTEETVRLFVDDIGVSLTGLEGWDNWLDELAGDRSEFYLGSKEIQFGDTGFAQHYQDPYGGNQPHHFWYYVQARAWHTGAFAELNNVAHETFLYRGFPSRSQGRSFQDYLLGERGRQMLIALLNQDISFSEVGGWMRLNLGPTSDPWWYMFVFKPRLPTGTERIIPNGLEYGPIKG